MEAEITQTAPPSPTPLYDSSIQPPAADSPSRDLPPQLRPVFQSLRESCLRIPQIVERVRHEGPVWKWIWAYERDGFTLCVIHPMKESVDLSFPLPTRFEHHFEKSDLDKVILAAISKGETAARVRYVRVNVPDVEAVSRMYRAVELKLKLMAEDKKVS